MTLVPRPIRFILDGAPIAVDDAPPSTMLLDWLRTQARATGTKEGCAEGDCGACTVVLARREVDGTLRIEPCNACIRPLASVDGLGVLTVEGLGGAHPVQRPDAGVARLDAQRPVHLAPGQHHRAGAAVALGAPFLGAGCAGLRPQPVEQHRRGRRIVDGDRGAVEDEPYRARDECHGMERLS